MITATVTAEYNPMHSAHVMQLDSIRKKTDANAVVVLLSGNFVQRGGPAIVDKYERARTALAHGADLVLCLPFVYAAQTAEIFARGAVNIAKKIKTDFFCFGCEEERFADLKKAALALNSASPEAGERIKQLMYGEKLPYAAARLAVLAEEAGFSDCSFLKKPNNILALEYLRAAFSTKVAFKIVPNDIVSAGYCSASELRTALFCGNADEYLSYFPGNILPAPPYRAIGEYNFIFKAFISALSQETLTGLCEGDEALAARLCNLAALLGKSVECFVSEASAKNYTRSRIRRSLVNMAVGYTKEDMALFRSHAPTCIKVLGANSIGRELINEINERGDITLTGNLNKHFRDLGACEKRLYALEEKADNLYKLFTEEFDSEMKRPPIIF